MIRRIDQARQAVVYGLLAILLAAVFVPMSLFRLVDGDEGTYLLVSRLVVEGQFPYHDFYYPQMFLLPYVYGAWMKLVGYSWYGARLLSAAFSVILALLVYRQVALLVGSRAWGALAVVLLCFSSLAFGWYPLIKTFVLPTLLLFAAYAVVSTQSRWKWVASGFLLGLSVACRVYVIGVAPAFLLEIYLTEPERKPRLMQVARFAIGLLLALLPTEFFFLVDPSTFVFNVVGSQIIRTDYQSASWWYQKTLAPKTLMALGTAEGVTSVQFVLLFLVNVASWVSCALSRARLPLASSIAVLLTLASLVPTPTYTQYFCMPLPFLLVSAVTFCATLTRESTGPRLRHLLASLAVTYVLLSPLDLYRYTVSGVMVPGILPSDSVTNWRLTTIRAVGQAIDREAHSDRPLAISLWPGYLVETRAAILPGMENHFALMFANRVTPREVAQLKLMSYSELAWHIHRHTVDVIVLGNWTNWIDRKELILDFVLGNPTNWIGNEALIRNLVRGNWRNVPEARALIRNYILRKGYTLKERVAQAEIYALPRRAARQ